MPTMRLLHAGVHFDALQLSTARAIWLAYNAVQKVF